MIPVEANSIGTELYFLDGTTGKREHLRPEKGVCFALLDAGEKANFRGYAQHRKSLIQPPISPSKTTHKTNMTNSLKTRRNSFSEFIRDPNLRRNTTNTNSSTPTSRANLFDRLVHINALLGYAIMLAGLFIVPWLVFYSAFDWMKVRDRIPQMSPWAGAILGLPAIMWTISIVPLFYQTKKSFLTFGLPSAAQFLAMPAVDVVWCAVMYLMIEILEIDVRRYSIDLILAMTGLILAVFLILLDDKRRYKSTNSNSGSPSIEEVLDTSFWKHQIGVGIIIINFTDLTFMAFIVPQFFASDTPMRLFIVLFVLPVFQELTDLLFRAKELEHAVEWVSNGVEIERAKLKLSHMEFMDVTMKQSFCLFKRFMLLSLGLQCFSLFPPTSKHLKLTPTFPRRCDYFRADRHRV